QASFSGISGTPGTAAGEAPRERSRGERVRSTPPATPSPIPNLQPTKADISLPPQDSNVRQLFSESTRRTDQKSTGQKRWIRAWATCPIRPGPDSPQQSLAPLPVRGRVARLKDHRFEIRLGQVFSGNPVPAQHTQARRGPRHPDQSLGAALPIQ